MLLGWGSVPDLGEVIGGKRQHCGKAGTFWGGRGSCSQLSPRTLFPWHTLGSGPSPRSERNPGGRTCSRRQVSAAHSTSQEALSPAYCCCSRRRARSSSHSSTRSSSSSALSAQNSGWFSATCRDTGRLCHLTRVRTGGWQAKGHWCRAVSKVGGRESAQLVGEPGPLIACRIWG